jgi:hypothetical protein
VSLASLAYLGASGIRHVSRRKGRFHNPSRDTAIINIK